MKTPTVLDLIAALPGGRDILTVLPGLGLVLERAGGIGTESFGVLALRREDGSTVVVIAKDGKIATNPTSLGMVVAEIVEITQEFATISLSAGTVNLTISTRENGTADDQTTVARQRSESDLAGSSNPHPAGRFSSGS